jgi:hypothetical protein
MTRKEYLTKLDAFMLHLGADMSEGRILGAERHEEVLAVLLRHRPDLDDAPRKGNPRVTDGLDAAEKALHEVRAALRNGV